MENVIKEHIELVEGESQLIHFCKVELNEITSKANRPFTDQTLLFNESVVNIITKAAEIEDPMLLNAFASILFNLRIRVQKEGITCEYILEMIDMLKKADTEENTAMGSILETMVSELSEVYEQNESIQKIKVVELNKLFANIFQRIVYLISWIPLRTFNNIEDLQLNMVGGTVERAIYQSSIAGRVYLYTAFSDVPYIANGITFKRELDDGTFEPYICDESRVLIKFPLKSSHFIPTVIRIDKNEKVFKQDRVKYKRIKKRILSANPRFLG